MKYIIKNDLNTFKKIIALTLIIYFVPLITHYLITILNPNINIDNEYILTFLSLRINILNDDWIYIIFYLMYLCFNILIMYSILTTDTKNNNCNIFLRVTGFKWFNQKLISIFLFMFLLGVIRYIIIGLLVGFKINIFNSTYIFYVLKQLINMYLINLVGALIYIIAYQKKEIILLIIILGILYPSNFTIIPISITILLIICINFIIIIFLKNRHTRFIERRN